MTTQPEALRLAEWIEGDMSCQGDAEIAAELRRLHQSEREGWRYATELEQERKRLQSEVDRLTQHILDQNRELGDELIPMAEKLETQRDELLEALQQLCNSHKQFSGGVWDKARAAIAKAEGQA